MSAQIIPINESVKFGGIVETVNARDLHAFLEVGKDFTTWIKDRIDQYGFIQGQDFTVENFAPRNGGANRGGHNRRDYHISLDMAKELSMVERNAKGKQARQYFIECEQRAKSVNTPTIPTNMIEALELALEQQKQIVLTRAASGDTIRPQQQKSVVRLRIRSVIWRSDTRAKIAGFSMVGRTGEPKGSPLHMAVMRILLRLATRVSHLCGQFSKTNHMEVSL